MDDKEIRTRAKYALMGMAIFKITYRTQKHAYKTSIFGLEWTLAPMIKNWLEWKRRKEPMWLETIEMYFCTK